MKENRLGNGNQTFSVEVVPKRNLASVGDMITNFRGQYTDTLFEQYFKLDSGKVYGIISEYGLGCELLIYLLGGHLSKNTYDEIAVLIDGKETTCKELRELSWEIEPCKTDHENLIVRKSIENALKKHFVQDDFHTIAESFGLTEARYDRKLKQLSGERWFASMAIGYSLGKRIFFAPYQSSMFYKQCSARLEATIAKLKKENCLLLLPCGTDRIVKQFADQCLYVDQFDGIG